MTKQFIYKFFKEKFRSLSEALQLQAKEYKRRLDDLNGEAGRLRSMQSEYIPREVFDRTVTELRREIEELKIFKTKQEGRSTLLQYIPWVIAIAAIVANYFKK